jgi:hypothetical protein
MIAGSEFLWPAAGTVKDAENANGVTDDAVKAKCTACPSRPTHALLQHVQDVQIPAGSKVAARLDR